MTVPCWGFSLAVSGMMIPPIFSAVSSMRSDVSTQSRPDYMRVMEDLVRNRSGRVQGWDRSGWLRPLGKVHTAEEGLEVGVGAVEVRRALPA